MTSTGPQLRPATCHAGPHLQQELINNHGNTKRRFRKCPKNPKKPEKESP
jgi:hypothetical protein